MYHQNWKTRSFRGLGEMTCPEGQVGYPPACVPVPGATTPTAPPVDPNTLCPADKPYGVYPYCVAMPGQQPPSGGETNQTTPTSTTCPVDKPFGIPPWCYSLSQIPAGTQLPPMPTPQPTPGVPSTTQPGQQVPPTGEKTEPAATSPSFFEQNKALVIGAGAVLAGLVVLSMMKKKGPAYAKNPKG